MWYARLMTNTALKRFLSVFSVILMLGLTGCANLPQDGKDNAVQSFLSSIALPTPGNRAEQLFNQRFEAQILNPSASKAYQLRYTISGTSSSTLSVRGSSSTLVNSKSTLTYTLTDLNSGKKLLNGSVSAQATSGTISSYYGQEKSQQFVSERLSGLLAEKLMHQLSLFHISQQQS